MHHNEGRWLFRIPFGILLASLCALLSQAQPSSPSVMAPETKVTVEPKYTDAGLKERLLGAATLDVVVDEAGVPTEVKLTKWTSQNSLDPNPLGLDKAAIEAVRQWRFVPKAVDGMPVSFRATVEVHFDREMLLRQAFRQSYAGGLLPVPIILCSGVPGTPILVMRGSEIKFEPKGEEAMVDLFHEWDRLLSEKK